MGFRPKEEALVALAAAKALLLIRLHNLLQSIQPFRERTTGMDLLDLFSLNLFPTALKHDRSALARWQGGKDRS